MNSEESVDNSEFDETTPEGSAPYQPKTRLPHSRPGVGGALEELRKLRDGGKFDPMTFMIISSMIRREEREDARWELEERERRENMKKPAVNVKEEINKAIEKITEKLNPPTTKEKPGWAKNLEDQNTEILAKFSKDENEKATAKLIQDATHPFEDALKERDNTIKLLTTSLEEIKKKINEKPANLPEGTDKLDVYKEVDTLLKTLGIKPTEKSVYSLGGGEGMHVKGEIPAWVAYGPHVVDEILTAAEKRITNIAKNIGLTETEAEAPGAKELIRLPPRPELAIKQEQPSETTPAQQQPSQPQTQQPAAPTQPEIVSTEKIEPLIKLPPRPEPSIKKDDTTVDTPKTEPPTKPEHTITVYREGKEITIPESDIRPKDSIVLGSGATTEPETEPEILPETATATNENPETGIPPATATASTQPSDSLGDTVEVLGSEHSPVTGDDKQKKKTQQPSNPKKTSPKKKKHKDKPGGKKRGGTKNS